MLLRAAMFGNNVTSSWTTPQQNQQQPQQTSAFGQPAGFGTTGEYPRIPETFNIQLSPSLWFHRRVRPDLPTATSGESNVRKSRRYA